MELTIEYLSVAIRGEPILHEASLTVEDGEFLSLLGPSGCGKSTLLKAVAGILPVKSGRVLLGGRDITALPAHRRGAVVVFQDMRLFPHMTAAENVAYPLAIRGMARPRRMAEAEALLERVQLGGLGKRHISALSGGQQQRVALARALAAQPRLLLLDEPFSSLDEDLREDMRRLVLDLHREYAMTTVLVTHDQQEALALSGQVALMFDGRVVQQGTPEAVYDRPVSRRAADYFGGCAYFRGAVRSGRFVSPCLSCPADLPEGTYDLLLRSRDIDLTRPGPLRLRLESCRFRGADVLTRWAAEDGTAVELPLAQRPLLPPGHVLACHADLDQAVFFPAGKEGSPCAAP